MHRPTAPHVRLRRLRPLATLLGVATIVSLLPTPAAAAPKPPSVTIADVVASESAGTAMFTIKTKPRPRPTGPISVDWATSDGTALQPADYVTASGTVTLTNSSSTATVNVPITADVLDEPNETFTVNLSNVVGPGAIADAQAVGTITDDDTPPTIAIDDVVVGEGDSGSSAATFTLSLSGPSGLNVTVDWATANGTATQPSDYASGSGTATFVPGDSSETVVVTVNGDTDLELDETFIVGLTNPTNATVSDGSGTGTIVADEVEPVVSIGNASVAEGDAGSSTLTFPVTLSRAGLATATVDWDTSDGTAVAPGDYTDESGAVTFAVGDVEETVEVTVNGDTAFEVDETLTLTLSNLGNSFMGDGTGVGTISNDDPMPSLSISDVSVVETDTGTATAVFDFTLSDPSAASAGVNWTTVDGTALVGSDYVGVSGVVSFAPGDVSEAVSVDVNGDIVDEAAEWFSVVVSAPDGAVVADDTGRATIVDDDQTPTALTLRVRKRLLRVIAMGRLEPAKSGFTVTVALSRRRANGTFAWLRSHTVTVTKLRDRDGDGMKEGAYRTAFPRPKSNGTYRLTARFKGTATHAPSSKRIVFSLP